MKTHDALGRRLANAGRQPTGKIVRPTTSKLQIMRALARHGPLPAPILYAFGSIRGYDNFRKMLRDMYHERSVHGGAYLERPLLSSRRSQNDARVLALDFQPAVYQLTKAGHAALTVHEPDYTPPQSGPLVHQILTASVTASIELAARRAGCQYLAAHDILADEKCPEETRRAQNPLKITVGGTSVIPDALFGIVYPDNRKRRFLLELDRGTESHRRSGNQRNTVAKKLDTYPKVYERELHRQVWGIPKFAVLTLTTSGERARNIMEQISRRPDLFLFKAQRTLGTFWEVPSTIPELFEEPWDSVHGPIDISQSQLHGCAKKRQ